MRRDAMIFERKFTTMWHDTDAHRRVRPTQLLVYMQETSNKHTECCGMPLDTLRDEKGLAFILSKIRFAVYQPLFAFEEIRVQTWTRPSRGFSITRFFRILRGEQVIAEADTTWALVDINSGTPVKGEVCDGIYSFLHDEPIEVPVPPRFRLPAALSLEEIGKRRIVYSDLDYNMHMNNTKYPDMLCDFLELDEVDRVKGFLLSYVHESAFGDELTVCHAYGDGVHYFKTVNQNGVTCLEAQVLVDEK